MKKILALVFLGLLANCAHDLTDLRAPKIKGTVAKSATLYISPEMKKNHVFSSKTMVVGANITSGVKNDDSSWSQNIGELSARQFQDALKLSFTKLEVSTQKSAGNNTYLIVPTIVKADVVIRDYLQSYIVLTYKLEVYDKSGKLVYSDEIKVEEKGKFKSASMTSVGGIPIMGKANIRPNESPMIFEAVSEGVDEIVNKLVKSGKL